MIFTQQPVYSECNQQNNNPDPHSEEGKNRTGGDSDGNHEAHRNHMTCCNRQQRPPDGAGILLLQA
jgi:hypothetical protein